MKITLRDARNIVMMCNNDEHIIDDSSRKKGPVHILITNG